MEFVTTASLAVTAFLMVDFFALRGTAARTMPLFLLLALIGWFGWQRKNRDGGQPRFLDVIPAGGLAVLLCLLFF